MRTFYDGRTLGTKATATREGILGALNDALAGDYWHEVSVTTIMNNICKSPGVFYQYFPHLRAAVYALAEAITDAGGELPAHLQLIMGFFSAEEALLIATNQEIARHGEA